MATLVSPGTSVEVTDDSFFIPAASPTVPLLFLATAENKLQPNALLAVGTTEHNVVRTITSAEQSLALYGLPLFKTDFQGNPQHGDARNEYGLFALNQFLGVGNRAFVVRANVNLNDDLDDIRLMWADLMNTAAAKVESLATRYLNEYNLANGFIPSNPSYKVTLTQSELISIAEEATVAVWDKYNFRNADVDFFADHTTLPLVIYGNGYDQPATGSFLGFGGMVTDWVGNMLGSVVGTEWTPLEASDTLLNAADDFKFTAEFQNLTSLGADDASRRVAIVTALAAAINNPTASFLEETYDFNLLLAPGYYEVVDELVALAVNLKEEMFVIADTPMNMTPEEVVDWADNNNERQHSKHVAYYYPHGIGSNIDGSNVLSAASGIALRTYAYNDVVGELWFAPAGVRRGLVSGISAMGYVKGTLGHATEFVSTVLNQGQQDNLYKYTTNVNHITFVPGQGIAVMGQKTSTGSASALDRVNVARLLAYVKRQIRRNTVAFLFEPNDQRTRDNVKAAVDGLLNDIMHKRGLYDFVTLCDESNNDPATVDRNEMVIDIAIKPTKALEFLYAPIRVVSTGATL